MWGNKKPEPPPHRPAFPEPASRTDAHVVAQPREEIKMSPNETAYSPAVVDRNSARLGPGLHIKGEITGSEDLLIEGTVEGLIQLEERKLTIGTSATVTADIIAREVVVYGNVKGNLRARDRIEIKKDGSVAGDLTTARIMIEDGAYFKGAIEIDRAGDASGNGASAPRPIARAAGTFSSD
jgi:cytoskeletal protein CcmA (bactofilin family)